MPKCRKSYVVFQVTLDQAEFYPERCAILQNTTIRITHHTLLRKFRILHANCNNAHEKYKKKIYKCNISNERVENTLFKIIDGFIVDATH